MVSSDRRMMGSIDCNSRRREVTTCLFVENSLIMLREWPLSVLWQWFLGFFMLYSRGMVMVWHYLSPCSTNPFGLAGQLLWPYLVWFLPFGFSSLTNQIGIPIAFADSSCAYFPLGTVTGSPLDQATFSK